ncbi:MAG: hypothetical protein IIC97_12680, partial [Chloroflexi bacterium]|nr:hypothetical protein [Chloroflexota bacterium]
MPDLTEERPSAGDLESLIGHLQPPVAVALNRALEGDDVSIEDALALFETSGLEYNAVVMVADELRRRTVGDVVTYV